MSDATNPEAQLSLLHGEVARLRAQVARAVVGQTSVLDGVLTCLLTGGHALLEGVPGVGKTLLVRTVASALSLSYARIQFTPDLMPADIVGTTMLLEERGGARSFGFERGPVFTHVVLADEVNRATPKTQSALLEVMQEHTVTIGRTTHALEEPFCVLATQNPLEMEGTYPLPEAQLDRFLLKLLVGFPSHDELHAILDRTTGVAAAPIEPVWPRERVLKLREVVRAIALPRPVQDYAVRLVEATHPGRARGLPSIARFVRYGASPRGAQAILLASKVRAALAGRFAVAVDDVRASLHPALRHRLILGFEGQAEGVTTDALLDELLTSIPDRA